MADKRISDAAAKPSLENTDMIPLAADGDNAAYHVTGETIFGSLPDATTAQKGRVELATEAEAASASDSVRAVTPSGLMIKKTGSGAIIVGDLSGNSRGDSALDVQSARISDRVASGSEAVCIGIFNKASGMMSLALGYNNEAGGLNCASVGYDSKCLSDYSTALGYRARARIARTASIGGAIINRKDDGESASTAFESFCGTQVVLMSKEVDLTSTTDETLSLPSGCKFFVDEIGIIVTSAESVTVQPEIRAGWVGDLDGLLAAVQTAGLTLEAERQRFTSMLTSAGKTSLTAGVTTAATATALMGRFYWKGLLVEDE